MVLDAVVVALAVVVAGAGRLERAWFFDSYHFSYDSELDARGVESPSAEPIRRACTVGEIAQGDVIRGGRR
jgi:hypothetical protein